LLNLIHLGFDWNGLPRDSVVVDVGGGVGSQTAVLAKAFDHINFVVQDRPTVIEDSAASVRRLYSRYFTSLIIISVLEG
jgi:protein-L-isoaspartate O-methyltransferase